MSYYTAKRFCLRYGGVDSLIKFFNMLNSPDAEKRKVETIAKEFKMSNGMVSQYKKKLCVELYEPQKEVLLFIKENADWRIEEFQRQKDFVRTEESKIIRHEFKAFAEYSGT